MRNQSKASDTSAQARAEVGATRGRNLHGGGSEDDGGQTHGAVGGARKAARAAGAGAGTAGGVGLSAALCVAWALVRGRAAGLARATKGGWAAARLGPRRLDKRRGRQPPWPRGACLHRRAAAQRARAQPQLAVAQRVGGATSALARDLVRPAHRLPAVRRQRLRACVRVCACTCGWMVARPLRGTQWAPVASHAYPLGQHVWAPAQQTASGPPAQQRLPQQVLASSHRVPASAHSVTAGAVRPVHPACAPPAATTASSKRARHHQRCRPMEGLYLKP
jgi:hypothetical protein